MKTVNFTNIHIENFGKHTTPIKHELGHRVVVSGANATGKSTIKRAIQYILGSRDENGKEITGIRPHDENGVDIDGLTTVAELGISVDGAENKLKKTYFQKKNRQGEYTGENDMQYFIDDVKKGTKKAYDEFVSGFLPSMVCISAQELLMKDTAGRREMLSVFSKHDTDSIIDENPEFEPLRGKLKANTVAELKKAYNESIYGKGRGSNHVDGLQDELTKKGHEIEFELGKKVDIDVAELELLKNSLQEQIDENKAKQADVSKQFEEFDKLTDGIMELKFELSDLERKANEDLEKRRREISTEIHDAEERLSHVKHRTKLNEQDIETLESTISKNTILINATRKNWKTTNERAFDENSLICSYCGQEYPAEKKEQLRAEFESHKQEELADLTNRGNELKATIDKEKIRLDGLNDVLDVNKEAISEIQGQIKELETQYNSIPQSIDISDRPEVREIKRKIAEKEAAMQKGNSSAEIRKQLQDEGEDLQRQLSEVNSQLALAQKNVEIDEHVAELQKQQRGLSQQIADIDRELDLLKRFERKKAELLESDVNENFDFVQFRMFEPMQNGDLKDVCLITVGGESYDRNLNFSNRLLAEVDICRGFQRKYDVQLPILLDNAESVDDDRIPQVENQLIIFKRTDDKELKIECLEG